MGPLCLAAALALARAQAAPPRARVEAADDGVTRVWLKAEGDFIRAPSLALDPARRAPRRPKGAPAVTANGAGFSAAAEGTILIPNARVEFSTTGAWTLAYPLAEGEHLLGLGQDNRNNGRLDRRGTIRELWAGQQIESGNVTAQNPVPFLLSIRKDGRAFGLFLDNVHRLRFDLGKTKPDELRLEADGGELDLYVIDGPRPSDVLSRYTKLTGRPSLPPLWALGYWQSKCTYYDWTPLDEAYRQLTSRGFPVDVMVIDADWPEVMTDYVWAKRWIGKDFSPADKIADYAKKGVRIVMSQSGPMVKQESPTFAAGWAQGVFATDGKGNPVEAGWYGGKLLDFTHPKINDWLWPQTRKLNEQGVAGWWLDLTEPEGEPPQTHYHAGLPPEIHNQYSLLATRSFEGVQMAVHPDQRPFILTRAGSAGLQRHHAAVWTGDVYSDYATLRAHPPEMLNSTLSGLAYWTSDTGGFLVGDYKNDRFGAHARLYERWMQFSAFGPIARAHKAGGVPEPYALGTATEQGTRHYLQLRYRLMPYIYSYAWQASESGLPLTRALPLEFPQDPGSLAAPGDEYLFGRELLVAPVLHEGLANRAVYFPPGKWFDWDEGVEHEGGRTWVVAAPQNRIPVAVRAGAIIPMAPDMKNTSEKPWDPLTVEVFPSGRSAFTLYRDDGISFAYKKGSFTTTNIVSEEDGRHLRLTIAESNKLFTPKQYVLRFHLDRAPISVTGGQWRWDAPSRVLTVTLPSSAATRHAVTAALSAKRLSPRPAPPLQADATDPAAEAAGSLGRPIPHFFPPPPLPARIQAAYYDHGGEGVAYHSERPAPEPSSLRAGEWLRYTIDAVDGGYFDLSVRGTGTLRFETQGQTVAAASAPAAAENVYLNPGELTLLVSAESPASLDSFEFKLAAHAPTVYYATAAARRGPVDANKDGYVVNLGIKGSGLTFGVSGGAKGAKALRLRYANGLKKDVSLSLAIDAQAPRAVKLSPTEGGGWKDLDVPATLVPGDHRVALEGLESGWNTVQLESVEVLP